MFMSKVQGQGRLLVAAESVQLKGVTTVKTKLLEADLDPTTIGVPTWVISFLGEI